MGEEIIGSLEAGRAVGAGVALDHLQQPWFIRALFTLPWHFMSCVSVSMSVFVFVNPYHP